MVASAIRSVFEQPDGRSAREQLDRLIDGLARPSPRVADLLTAAEVDRLAHVAFPEAHRSRIRSTNPLERRNTEIERRTAVVGIFPNRAAVIRLVGMILAEQDDAWQDGRRSVRPETMTAIDAVPIEEVGQPLGACELIRSDAWTTRCSTTRWDLTATAAPGRGCATAGQGSCSSAARKKSRKLPSQNRLWRAAGRPASLRLTLPVPH